METFQTALQRARGGADRACLLVPNEGEGFGLPVFREVAGEYAVGAALAGAVRAWLTLDAESAGMPWHNAVELLAVLRGER